MQYLSTVDDYLNDLVHLRGLSKSTQITYRSALRQYGNWLVSVGAAKNADALTYQTALTKETV
ncbi:MAG: site-specific integrase, partial [Akkermansiaceae bacterium]|nr:site-specific integrase [Armatimonadota bacterium]